MSLLPPSHSPVFLPDELIAEVLSWIAVKPLLRLRCVSKSWKSLISDPTFVKLHLHRSSQNSDSKFVYTHDVYNTGHRSVSFTITSLFENPLINFPNDTYDLNDKDFHHVVGSCNGLLCLFGSSRVNGNIEKWFRFWNPATWAISPRLGSFCDDDPGIPFNFTFGCDKSNNTYKVVAFKSTKVRVFSLQDNTWRNIQNPPEVSYCSMKAVYLSGTVNWLTV
ncbi:F-box/kelch-repeat protein At3g23880-like [Vicia villosa]|uniref:F-box/kelch-repeat protein At3g23880-like n=1 Tax=Vicia villosa TaxID=3911 RepID=UPI00273ADCD9|nr:F-box/kelch-repeat protein At3g23880-like [Vicia villosa]